MDIQAFIKARPRLYHHTAESNIDKICRTGSLLSAAQIYERGGYGERVSRQREQSEQVHMCGDVYILRDQAPLREGQMLLTDGWSFEQFVAHINSHVYFWPGAENWIVSNGHRLFKKYAGEEPDSKILVIDTLKLIEINRERESLFSRYNSGSPRRNPIVGLSPRGPDTLVPAPQFSLPVSKVVECVFHSSVCLPMECVEIIDFSELLAKL